VSVLVRIKQAINIKI